MLSTWCHMMQPWSFQRIQLSSVFFSWYTCIEYFCCTWSSGWSARVSQIVNQIIFTQNSSILFATPATTRLVRSQTRDITVWTRTMTKSIVLTTDHFRFVSDFSVYYRLSLISLLMGWIFVWHFSHWWPAKWSYLFMPYIMYLQRLIENKDWCVTQFGKYYAISMTVLRTRAFLTRNLAWRMTGR